MTAFSERRDEVEAITGRLYNRKWTDRPPAAHVESLLNRLLTSLETAEERLELARQALVSTGHFSADEVGDDVAPRITELWSAGSAKQSDPVGVWQIELVNGTVHNFVASRCVGGGGLLYPGISSGLLEFVIDLPSGRSPVVLAVRSELVVGYRRVADWDGTEEQVNTFPMVPFGPVQGPKPPPTGTDWLKVTTKS